ncbi:MAG TPA: hypothetical protein VIM28_02060, partial [Solirubrobacterales bacterium]
GDGGALRAGSSSTTPSPTPPAGETPGTAGVPAAEEKSTEAPVAEAKADEAPAQEASAPAAEEKAE